MRIRSITCFYDPAVSQLAPMAELARAAVVDFTQAGFEVQTTRLATTPFPLLLGERKTATAAVELAQGMETAAVTAGFLSFPWGPLRRMIRLVMA
jgi:hypothetical protein